MLTKEKLGKGSVLEDSKSLSLSKLVVAITVTSVAAAFFSRLKKIYQNKDPLTILIVGSLYLIRLSLGSRL